jgi:hypothetical protein
MRDRPQPATAISQQERTLFCEADRRAHKIGLSQLVQAQGDVALLHLLIRAPTESAMSYRLIQGRDSVDSDCPEMGPTLSSRYRAATASRRLILLLTGQETVTPHFAPRAARTAERSVVDIAPL